MDNNTELIIKYLREELDAEEIAKVEARLQTDSTFKEEVEDYKKILNGFKVQKVKTFQNKLRKWANEEKENASSPISDNNIPSKSTPEHSFPNKSKGQRKLIRVGMMMGLLLLSLFLVYKFNSGNSNSSTTANQITQINPLRSAIEFEGNQRGEMVNGQNIVNTEKANSIYKNSVIAFDNKNYPQCIVELNKINENEACYPNAQYLLAHAFLKNENYLAAAATFKIIYDQEILYNYVGRKESGRLSYLSTVWNYRKNKTDKNKNIALIAIEHFINNAFEDYQQEIEDARKYKLEITNG